MAEKAKRNKKTELSKRKTSDKPRLRIIPLGGVGEIGKNMTVIEYGEDMIVVDCGISFPDEDIMPGIDAVIPDMSYLRTNRAKLRGFLITHGHEDHIGALPYALKEFNVPVYGTDFTVALIEHKLEENHLENCTLISKKPGEKVDLGCFTVEFIKTGHSIAGAVAFAIRTPIGTIIHTGDFKVDLTPIDGEPIDIAKFADYGSHGVLALLADSTNVERMGHTPSEKELGKTFEQCFDTAKGRVIVATFASNVYRIQQVADVAVAHGRYLCFQGRSMEQVTQIAIKYGYLKIPSERILDIDQLCRYRDDQVCVLTTGSQGEPMSGLFRMATSKHKLNIGKGDTVVISASAIPGNEKSVTRVINSLFEKGADVVYEPNDDVHVSGHARREELRLMMALTKPRFFIPVHGEYRHLSMHGELAVEMGIPQENVFQASLGDVVELTRRSGSINGKVEAGEVLVDGSIGMVDQVINDRIQLSKDGIVVAVLVLDVGHGTLMADPEIVSRGFIHMQESADLIKETVEFVSKEARMFSGASKEHYSRLKSDISFRLKSFLRGRTKRSPMVIVHIIEI